MAAREDAGRLCFDSVNGTVHCPGDLVQGRDYRPASQSVSPLEHYREGRADIVLHLASATEAHVFDLVFRSVPSAVSDLGFASEDSLGDGDVCSHGVANGNNESVGAWVPYAVQSPKEVISSFVRLEPFKQRPDFDWIVPQARAGQFTLHAREVLREGEASSDGIGVPQGDGCTVASMVKRVPKVSGGFFDDKFDMIGEWSSKADLVNLLTSLSVRLDHTGVWLTVEERGDFPFSFSYLRLCPRDEALRA